MALRGIRVIELAGLAPSPFCGMILADFGAEVIKIDRVGSATGPPVFGRGKRQVSVDMKTGRGKEIITRMCKTADVLIEPFRKGVMEKHALGPREMLAENPRLVYARLSGFGQSGHYSDRAGHDINYLSIAGVLWCLRRPGQRPHAPVNIVADFAGGGLMCALGIVLALHERTMSGKGQVVDANMVSGSAYVSSFIYQTKDMGICGQEPVGTNVLDGGLAYYDTYETKDGKYISVGALEPQFFAHLVKTLDRPDLTQGMSKEDLRPQLEEIFRSQTQEYWTEKFDYVDACVTPVLSPSEAQEHHHNVKLFDNQGNPNPAPILSQTPGVPGKVRPPNSDTVDFLKELGYVDSEIEYLVSNNIVGTAKSKM